MQNQCPTNFQYNLQTQICEHYVFPLNIYIIIAFISTFIVAGFASLAGVGGGTPHLVLLMLLYNYTPKNATIVIFSAILGTTLGNVLSQMTKKINNQPIIQYQYAFISIPIMFMGSIIGVLINKLSPTIIICGFIMYIAATSIQGIYKKFIQSYKKQTNQINYNKNISINSDINNSLLLDQAQIQQKIINNLPKQQQKYIQTQFNPLTNPQYRYIFKNLSFLFITFITLSLIKGTQKLNSIIGIERCSTIYWVLYLSMFFIMAAFSYINLGILKKWGAQPIALNENNKLRKEKENNQYNCSTIENNINYVAKMSCMAGLFSGLGLGGGIFLVPMYKTLGCNSIQAAATCAFSIFTTSLLNCIQGILLGVIKIQDFFSLFTISITGSYVFCTFILKILQKKNRISLVQLVLLILVIIALINLPFSLYIKYVRSNYDTNILFGLGKLC